MDVGLVEKDHEMLVALGSREKVSNALDERLPSLRVGPSKKLFGFLPGQLEAVQGRSDRLATAHQPEARRSVRRGAGPPRVGGGAAAVGGAARIVPPSSAARRGKKRDGDRRC